MLVLLGLWSEVNVRNHSAFHAPPPSTTPHSKLCNYLIKLFNKNYLIDTRHDLTSVIRTYILTLKSHSNYNERLHYKKNNLC